MTTAYVVNEAGIEEVEATTYEAPEELHETIEDAIASHEWLLQTVNRSDVRALLARVEA